MMMMNFVLEEIIQKHAYRTVRVPATTVFREPDAVPYFPKVVFGDWRPDAQHFVVRIPFLLSATLENAIQQLGSLVVETSNIISGLFVEIIVAIIIIIILDQNYIGSI